MKLAGRVSEIAAVVAVVESAVRDDGGALLIFWRGRCGEDRADPRGECLRRRRR